MPATTPPEGATEAARLAELYAYDVLDTPPERNFDDIAGLAALLCGTPMALISLVDEERQWFKARIGVGPEETPRDDSFCVHAMRCGQVMEVPDARADPRFADNPQVVGAPYIRFYAGAPLLTATGQPLGSVCVIDREPRRLTPEQTDGLAALARHVMMELDLRRHAASLGAANRRLRDAESVRDRFLARVSHELRTPLTSIHGYLEALEDEELPPGSATRFMAVIRRNSDRLLTLVDDMLLAAQVDTAPAGFDPQPLDLTELAAQATADNRPIAAAKGLEVTGPVGAAVPAVADRARLGQALHRLLLNAVKFTSLGGITVTTGAGADGRPFVAIADTGIGMTDGEPDTMFAPFSRSDNAEEAEIQGLGLGLTIVKAIVDEHGGTIGIDSALDTGTTVTISLPAPTG